MAAVNVTGTFTSTSAFRGTCTGIDIRVLNGDLTSNWAVHIMPANKIYLVKNGVALTFGTNTDMQSLWRLLANAFSGS
jgi:hypothetical protein